MQSEALTGPEDSAVAGLTNPRGLGLSRVPVRARELSMTVSAWRLSLVSDEGEGTITLVELTREQLLYRGDGVCLGWTQERLARASEALTPKDETAEPEAPQLG